MSNNSKPSKRMGKAHSQQRRVSRRREVWINHFAGEDARPAMLLKTRTGSDWPYLVKVPEHGRYWWAHIYLTRRSAISALGGYAAAKSKAIKAANAPHEPRGAKTENRESANQ